MFVTDENAYHYAKDCTVEEDYQYDWSEEGSKEYSCIANETSANKDQREGLELELKKLLCAF